MTLTTTTDYPRTVSTHLPFLPTIPLALEEEVLVGRGSLRALAIEYVGRRRRAGQINNRTATQLHSRLLDFCANAPTNPRRVYRHHVEKWMERPDLRPQYRRARLSALRGFTRWCVTEGHMAKDPCLLVPMPTVPPRLPKRLTEDESRRLVKATAHDRRLRLIVLLMLQQGLRRAEVAALNIEDIDFAERSMVIRGKGGQSCETDEIPITQETWRALHAYLDDEGHTHGPLIRNRVRRHGRMAPSSVSELVTEAMIECGIKRPGDRLRTPHSCRHTTAHDIMRKTGGNIYKTQKALRHRSVRSTEVYANGYTDDLREIMEGRTYAD